MLYIDKYTQPVLISVTTNVSLQPFVILCQQTALELKFYSINFDGIINLIDNAGINSLCW
jgi:hypothetical protein